MVAMKLQVDNEMDALNKMRRFDVTNRKESALIMLMKKVRETEQSKKDEFLTKLECIRIMDEEDHEIELLVVEKFKAKKGGGDVLAGEMPVKKQKVHFAKLRKHGELQRMNSMDFYQKEYMKWRKKKDFKALQQERFKQFLQDNENPLFQANQSILEAVQSIYSLRSILDVLNVRISVKLSEVHVSVVDQYPDVCAMVSFSRKNSR